MNPTTTAELLPEVYRLLDLILANTRACDYRFKATNWVHDLTANGTPSAHDAGRVLLNLQTVVQKVGLVA